MKPELLAPVGGRQQLIAAIENGADAVYLGGKLFNARQNADNFEDDELRQAIEYAHIRGVNAYLTLNTILKEEELEEALAFILNAYQAGIDALILQDFGFLKIVRERLPDLPIHLSTQGTIYNIEGVRMAERLGIRRVVLARELSIEEIGEIAKATSLELEVFVHGALCVCYSGQCHMSNMIGGRSGNRGVCAQPCRLPYSMISEYEGGGKAKGLEIRETGKGYFLSPKDLCGLDQLDRLSEAGVHSFKIEGRMKSPEYVATVTRTYRDYLDSYLKQRMKKPIDPRDWKDLNQIYNRGGFTTGYLLGNQGRELITRDRPKHGGIFLGKVVSRDEKRRSIDIRLEEALSMGDGIEIASRDLPGNLVTMMQKKSQRIDHAEQGDVVTVGYLDGKIQAGNSVYKLTDKALNRAAQESFSGKYLKRVPLTGQLRVRAGQPMWFEVRDSEGLRVEVESDCIPEVAIKKPLEPDTAKVQIFKTGSTPFVFTHCDFDLDEGLSIPIAELNQIRRQALDKLTEIRKNRYPNRMERVGDTTLVPHGILNRTNQGNRNSQNKTHQNKRSVYFYRWPSQEILNHIDVDRIYLPVFPLLQKGAEETIKLCKEREIEVFGSLPPVTRGDEDRIIRSQTKRLRELGLDGVLVGNIGQMEMLRSQGLQIMGDYSLNLYNTESVMVASELGLASVTLSHELTPQEIRNFGRVEIETEAVIYGRLPVMISEHCPIGSEVSNRPEGLHCGLCETGRYTLKDRKEAEFPILGDPVSCRATILNYERRDWIDQIKSFQKAGVSIFRYVIYDETLQEVQRMLRID